MTATAQENAALAATFLQCLQAIALRTKRPYVFWVAVRRLGKRLGFSHRRLRACVGKLEAAGRLHAEGRGMFRRLYLARQKPHSLFD